MWKYACCATNWYAFLSHKNQKHEINLLWKSNECRFDANFFVMPNKNWYIQIRDENEKREREKKKNAHIIEAFRYFLANVINNNDEMIFKPFNTIPMWCDIYTQRRIMVVKRLISHKFSQCTHFFLHLHKRIHTQTKLSAVWKDYPLHMCDFVNVT